MRLFRRPVTLLVALSAIVLTMHPSGESAAVARTAPAKSPAVPMRFPGETMPHPPITGLAPSCRSITDPYSKTGRELKACGYEVYPLIAIDTRSDGARVYVYDVNG